MAAARGPGDVPTPLAAARMLRISFVPIKMQPAYVRTRHKNVRCFPQCAGAHNERSFCGDSLIAIVHGGDRHTDSDGGKMELYGDFRSTDAAPVLRENDSIPSKLPHVRLLKATLVHHHPTGTTRFAFNPARKWECKARARANQTYQFTVYLAINGIVRCVADTDLFLLLPVSKAKPQLEAQQSSQEEEHGEEDEDEPQPTPVLPHRPASTVTPHSTTPFDAAIAPPFPLPTSLQVPFLLTAPHSASGAMLSPFMATTVTAGASYPRPPLSFLSPAFQLQSGPSHLVAPFNPFFSFPPMQMHHHPYAVTGPPPPRLSSLSSTTETLPSNSNKRSRVTPSISAGDSQRSSFPPASE